MPKRLFISYSHADEARLSRLHKHLAQLQREGSVNAWYDREITAGGRLDDEIASELKEADIFIAALSPDFIASHYCYEIELETALRREADGTLIIVPVVFEPCDWKATPLGKFNALPRDGKSVSEFANENVALLSIISELRRLITVEPKIGSVKMASVPLEGSNISRYRIKRNFDKIDKRDFVDRSFEEIRNFFHSSIIEINSIEEIAANLNEESRDSFSCTIINRGYGREYCTVTIRKNGSFGDIELAFGEKPSRTGSNGGFSVESDEYELYFASHTFGFSQSSEKKLAAIEVAKIIWDDVLKKVGVDYA